MKHLELFSKALLGKWRWRVLNEKGTLWVRVLKANYGKIKTNLTIQKCRIGSHWGKDIVNITKGGQLILGLSKMLDARLRTRKMLFFGVRCGWGMFLWRTNLWGCTLFLIGKIMKWGNEWDGSWVWRMQRRMPCFEWENPTLQDLCSLYNHFSLWRMLRMVGCVWDSRAGVTLLRIHIQCC